jgi:hypothetical protein
MLQFTAEAQGNVAFRHSFFSGVSYVGMSYVFAGGKNASISTSVADEYGEDIVGEQMQEAEEEDYCKTGPGQEASGQDIQGEDTEGQQLQGPEKDSDQEKPRPEASRHGEQKAKDDSSRMEACRQENAYWARQQETDPKNYYQRWWNVQMAEVRAIAKPSPDDEEYWKAPCGFSLLTNRQHQDVRELAWEYALQQVCCSSSNGSLIIGTDSAAAAGTVTSDTTHHSSVAASKDSAASAGTVAYGAAHHPSSEITFGQRIRAA